MMYDDNKYFDRDLSWLSFNYRVLMEAMDEELPLYERLKFVAIYSSNLEEFFRVRVASIRSLLRVKKKQRKKLGLDPKSLLAIINFEVEEQQEVLGKLFNEDILPNLEKRKIKLLLDPPTQEAHQHFLDEFFKNEVLPNMHPVLLRRNKIVHFLRDGALYLAVRLIKRKINLETGEEQDMFDHAIVQIPTHYFPRFIELPKVDDEVNIMFLDDVVRFNLDKIFPGYNIDTSHSIKLTRDADLMIEDEFTGNLVDKIKDSLSKRKVGLPSRFLYDGKMPEELLKYLVDSFKLNKHEVMEGGRHHSFSDFFSFPNPVSPLLERIIPPPLRDPEIDQFENIFEAIKARNYLLHFPYHTYDHVLSFLNQAAADSDVVEIKTTQYRVASNSAIVAALIRAAQNGKKVTVFVEIKARFDEASNLNSAREMEAAGVKIIYSFPVLKVHAKVALVHRQERDKLQPYAFLSTGNFNEKTARLYADHGLFTRDEEMAKELEHVFSFLTDRNYQPPPFKLLLVAQFNMKEDFKRMIDREIEHVKAGRPGYILIKLNNLEHYEMIDKLYEASQAGVKIALIVRGICCLRPGIPGLSENIKAIRIVDQYLEHARVYLFYNNGANDIYLASADWMRRNLDRRVEVAFPVRVPALKDEILHILNLQLEDNTKAVQLDANINNIPIERPEGAPEVRAQVDIYNLVENGTLGQL